MNEGDKRNLLTHKTLLVRVLKKDSSNNAIKFGSPVEAKQTDAARSPYTKLTPTPANSAETVLKPKRIAAIFEKQIGARHFEAVSSTKIRIQNPFSAHIEFMSEP